MIVLILSRRLELHQPVPVLLVFCDILFRKIAFLAVKKEHLALFRNFKNQMNPVFFYPDKSFHDSSFFASQRQSFCHKADTVIPERFFLSLFVRQLFIFAMFSSEMSTGAPTALEATIVFATASSTSILLKASIRSFP